MAASSSSLPGPHVGVLDEQPVQIAAGHAGLPGGGADVAVTGGEDAAQVVGVEGPLEGGAGLGRGRAQRASTSTSKPLLVVLAVVAVVAVSVSSSKARAIGSPGPARASPRVMRFFSSRILPAKPCSRRRARSAATTSCRERPAAARKADARGRISSRRSRSGGMVTATTARRW
jgi:hypothetical protein